MSITFIHTADWQIGKTFGDFPVDTQVLLRRARLDAIDRIAAVAMAAGARHVLVAGDVFDKAKPPERVIGELLARLAKHRDLDWHLLPGNHDPAQAGYVWDDVARSNPASNIHLHITLATVELEPNVLLIPAPLHAKAMSDDPTAFMDQVSTPDGTIRIGMAHGSVKGFDSLGEPSIPIKMTRAESAKLDYLALGDWHGLAPINSRTWYSGTHEPDSYKNNKPGHVLVVTIAGPGAIPEVRPVPTNHYQWRRHALALTSADDVETFAAALDAEKVARDRILLKLDLSGRVPLGDFGTIKQLLDALAYGLTHLDADVGAIETRTGADDLGAFGQGTIATIAQRLATLSASSDAAEQQNATRALRELAKLVGQAS